VSIKGVPAKSASVHNRFRNVSKSTGIEKKEGAERRTIHEDQLTENPPLGSWSVKKIISSASILVPIHIPDTCQYTDVFTIGSSIRKQSTVQRGTRNVVVLAPPCEVALANDELEHEPDCKPGRVIDSRRGRNI
jgi:hypothetical protein